MNTQSKAVPHPLNHGARRAQRSRCPVGWTVCPAVPPRGHCSLTDEDCAAGRLSTVIAERPLEHVHAVHHARVRFDARAEQPFVRLPQA
ncbi:hypothetical protein ABTZ03_36910 [Kitasatospora sp. NPDC096077]|uniref:hypothetical protein n=1 Tax=Kitasatospora sp. NPDC096077 TaxID=3155544 RepID=UPI003321C1CD